MTASTTRAGRFQFTPAVGRWWWSDEMFRIHGMEPGEVVPTKDLFLSHVHPADRPGVAEMLEARGDPEAGSCDYRLVDLVGTERHVTLVLAHEHAGDSLTTSGFVVDSTRLREEAVAARVNEQLSAALQSHSVIDQAKGVLMLTYGVESETAFAMMRTSSQQHNVRLRDLASGIVSAVSGGLEAGARGRMDDVVSAVLSRSLEEGPAPAEKTALDLRLDCATAVPVLRVVGSVDLSNRDDLAAAVAVLVGRGRDVGSAVVDLSGVRRVGAAVGDVLTSALRRAADHGVVLTIVGGQPRVRSERVRAPSSSRAPSPRAPSPEAASSRA